MMDFIVVIAAVCGIVDFVIEHIKSVRKVIRRKKMSR